MFIILYVRIYICVSVRTALFFLNNINKVTDKNYARSINRSVQNPRKCQRPTREKYYVAPYVRNA